MANAFSILFGAGQNGMKIPVTKEELYRRLEFSQPDPDADLYDPLGGAIPSSPESQESGKEPPPEAGLGGDGALKQAGGKIEQETSEFLPASAAQVEAKEAVEVPKFKKLERGPVEEAQALANEAWFKQMSGAIKGVKWRSKIDNRTTPECLELNRKRWSYPDLEPMGHDVQWQGWAPLHYNCRSQVTPIYKTPWAQVKASWLPRLKAILGLKEHKQ